MKVAGSGRPRRWIRPSSTSEPAVSASAASSVSEFSASVTRALGPDADQHDPLEPQLPVLDLGDVGELGGEPGDAPQRVALLELKLAGGDVGLEKVSVRTKVILLAHRSWHARVERRIHITAPSASQMPADGNHRSGTR